ncbi:BGP_1a_G0040100.mRNA.1.CDS.1 [Saccharomyces cerevisiae]|nr:BGP_1a_G0040100.mRNA.1.CDS.1 [Saccharomyces cerevisiae]CAI7230183.1 BGP_1a_G0040100.mRNA.1.CDS.1 [Saccharomyces cerevisiae]
MSLEEFLGNDTLGESVWDEEDINLDAISNTTNIDILKQTKAGEHQRDGHQQHPHGGHGPMNRSRFSNAGPFGGGSMGDFANHHHPLQHQQGPPYIVKFSDLPPRFSNFDIEDLFQAKFTKFIKFKLFWEINKNPSISTLKSGSIFDQNFKRDSKVAFVELYTSRDMDKILNYWTTPLKEIYHVTTAPAEFEDFKDYSTKVKLLTDPKDDAGKPFITKTQRSKSNPFGSAKPVDTQSKILDIEEKMENLHVEDTTTLRASLIPSSDSMATTATGSKITILKKQTPTEEESHSATPTPKPLSYSEVVERSVVNETSKKGTPLSKLGSPALELQSKPDKSDEFKGGDEQGFEKGGDDKAQLDVSNDKDKGSETDVDKQFTFKNVEREHSMSRTKYNGNHNNNNGNFRGSNRYRGGPNGSSYKGGHNNRGNRGGYRGGSSYNNNNNNNTNDNNNNNNSSSNNNNGSRYHDRQNNEEGLTSDSSLDASGNKKNDFTNSTSNTQQYSIFKPASGFLGQGNNDSIRNNGRGNYNSSGMNGGSRGRGFGRERGFGRGAYNNRGSRGGRGSSGNHSNYNNRTTDMPL